MILQELCYVVYVFVSVQPNCFSKIISVEGTKHIVIFALRTLVQTLTLVIYLNSM